MAKNKKSAAKCAAVVEALTERHELESINHATEIRRLRSEYAARQCEVAQRAAKETELAYTRLQVVTGILCALFFLVGVTLGIGICLMGLI